VGPELTGQHGSKIGSWVQNPAESGPELTREAMLLGAIKRVSDEASSRCRLIAHFEHPFPPTRPRCRSERSQIKAACKPCAGTLTSGISVIGKAIAAVATRLPRLSRELSSGALPN
jgi:hypothetical protein